MFTKGTSPEQMARLFSDPRAALVGETRPRSLESFNWLEIQTTCNIIHHPTRMGGTVKPPDRRRFLGNFRPKLRNSNGQAFHRVYRGEQSTRDGIEIRRRYRLRPLIRVYLFTLVSQGNDFRRQIATLRKFGGNQPWSLFRATSREKLLPFLNIELGIVASWARCIGVIDLVEREGNYWCTGSAERKGERAVIPPYFRKECILA